MKSTGKKKKKRANICLFKSNKLPYNINERMIWLETLSSLISLFALNLSSLGKRCFFT